MVEFELTETQRHYIEESCLKAISSTEDLYDNLKPAPFLKEALVGTRNLKWFNVLYPTTIGLISLFIWRWLIAATSLDQVLRTIGIPAVVVDNLPEASALLVAASIAWMGAYAWGVEGRVEYATRAENASRRAAVLHSVVEALSDTLPGAVPDMSEYASQLDDDSPNQLIERALGRSRGLAHRPRPHRNDLA